MDKKEYFRKVIYAIVVLVLAGTILYSLWLGGAFLPRWIVWEENDIADLSGTYETSLIDKTVSVWHQGTKIWDSPKNVKVQQMLYCDIDRDNADELILLCWKRGRFGKHKPFWIKKDEKNWSQHIFVYEYKEDKVWAQWMSSYIGQDVASMAAWGEDVSSRMLVLTDPKGEISYWRWGSWGFAKEDAAVSFAVFGDNLIHEPIYRYGFGQGGNFDFLFENIGDILTESDITVINQETPFVTEPKEYGDYPRFGTPIQVGEAIADAGFDIATCATNHALDRGIKGIHTTKEFFTKRGVLCLGIQTEDEPKRKPYEIVVKKGIRFAFLNYTYGTNGISLPKDRPYMVHLLDNEEQIRQDLAAAKKEADVMIVFAHWGIENSSEVDDFQKKWTNIFLEGKVDVVIGSHPHALQPYEMLEGADGHKMLTYYSIGNFISAQPEKSCIKGGVAQFTIAPMQEGCKVVDYRLKPLSITWQKGVGYRTVVAGLGE